MRSAASPRGPIREWLALDKLGTTINLLLRCDRGINVAESFLRRALASWMPRVPRKVTLHVSTARSASSPAIVLQIPVKPLHRPAN